MPIGSACSRNELIRTSGRHEEDVPARETAKMMSIMSTRSLVSHSSSTELADCNVDEHRRNKYGQLKCGPGERESRGEEWDR